MIANCTKWIERKFSGFNFLIGIYEIYYRGIVKKEVGLANIRSRDRVLCIGGGSIPCTALELANQTDAKIDVIDVDSMAVKSARDIVTRLGLSNRISIKEERGEDIDISSYDVIHVALQVTPKEKVIEHIWNNSKKGNRIIVRLPKRILSSFYSNISEEFISKNMDYIESCSLKNMVNTMDKVLLMVKN
ncbi:MAG: nicotianamine synthase family protein [Tissierellaceae bacterium]